MVDLKKTSVILFHLERYVFYGVMYAGVEMNDYFYHSNSWYPKHKQMSNSSIVQNRMLNASCKQLVKINQN